MILFIVGCKPETIGYLNDYLRYSVAELQAVQGSSITTNPLIGNGSTTPMTVKLVAVRNKETGAVVSEFLQEQDFSVYLGQVGDGVTTLTQLDELIGTDRAAALSVNEIGGKIVLTPATENVPAGLYTVDLEATNISGTKFYEGIIDINLIALKPDSLFSASVTSSGMALESDVVSISDDRYDVSITYLPDAEDKIIFVWEDKDGRRFNPKEGEVIRRSNLPSFADWSPFYAEELTDTAIVYPYPYFKGLPYPVKTSTLVGTTSFTDFSNNYRIKGDYLDLRRNLNTTAVTRFYKPGTHIVRYKLRDVAYQLPNLNRKTIVKNVVLAEGAGYTATSVEVDPKEIYSGLGLTSAEFADGFGTDIIFYAIQADGSRDSRSTAAAPGMWFDATGNTVDWGDLAHLFSEFKQDTWSFAIGQFPDKNVAGDTFVVQQSFVYVDEEGVTNEVLYEFNITIE